MDAIQAEPLKINTSHRPLSPSQMVVRRFLKHKMAIVGFILIVGIILFVSVGAYFSTEAQANHVNLSIKLLPPSSSHPFGTDFVGRDILKRTIFGGQISIIIGLLAVIISTVVGVLIGAISGYYGGIIENLLMRFTEAMFTIPQLFLLIVLAKFFGGKLPNIELFGRTFSGSVVVIIVVIGLTSWMYLARIVRANVLSLKEQEFITAAHSSGTKDFLIIIGHILPNTIAPIIVASTLQVANAILSEAYISFLGLGVQPPTATWGNMLQEAYKYLSRAPWLWFYPGMLILMTVMAINFVGDGLRDAFDPRSIVGVSKK